MRNLSLLTAKQAESYSEEFSFRLDRCPELEFYGCFWIFLGTNADWVGFQDDFGDFVPVDWC